MAVHESIHSYVCMYVHANELLRTRFGMHSKLAWHFKGVMTELVILSIFIKGKWKQFQSPFLLFYFFFANSVMIWKQFKITSGWVWVHLNTNTKPVRETSSVYFETIVKYFHKQFEPDCFLLDTNMLQLSFSLFGITLKQIWYYWSSFWAWFNLSLV